MLTHTSAYVSKRACGSYRYDAPRQYLDVGNSNLAYVSIRQHTCSAYVSIPAADRALEATTRSCQYLYFSTSKAAYVSIRQHTSAYVHIDAQHTSASVSIPAAERPPEATARSAGAEISARAPGPASFHAQQPLLLPLLPPPTPSQVLAAAPLTSPLISKVSRAAPSLVNLVVKLAVPPPLSRVLAPAARAPLAGADE
jgi:hypothetical protein